MRVILIDWLVGLSEILNISSGSLSLAVHLLDCALTTVIEVTRSRFQLLGSACLWLACKLEEIRFPLALELVRYSNYGFTVQSLTDMEVEVVRALGYDTNIPFRSYFCVHLGRASYLKGEEQALADFLCELSLYDATFSAHDASKVGSAAVHLALQMLRPRVNGGIPADQLWAEGSVTQLHSGFSEDVIVELVLQLRDLHYYFEDACEPHVALLRKWAKPQRHCVSQIGALHESDVCFSTERACEMAVSWIERERLREKSHMTEDLTERMDIESDAVQGEGNGESQSENSTWERQRFQRRADLKSKTPHFRFPTMESSPSQLDDSRSVESFDFALAHQDSDLPSSASEMESASKDAGLLVPSFPWEIRAEGGGRYRCPPSANLAGVQERSDAPWAQSFFCREQQWRGLQSLRFQ